ncbi:unnamed protein product [Parascedosporium putredinis]|uniref:Uncharacterized protein n=1 Tax=Parascedosporium putredinis TaxID=1442378 RepID=A0A9P1MDQ9_9PEZI|nr:unnamed protein product [Parascedosporium putredinis]CAI8001076.1 unnamed protein product [Parascedosporium putredinis]
MCCVGHVSRLGAPGARLPKPTYATYANGAPLSGRLPRDPPLWVIFLAGVSADAGAEFDPVTQSHSQASPPSYFAHKGNVFNRYFVKQGWAWVTASFAFFALTHPALGAGSRRAQAFARYGVTTLWWILVTQWFFGPALIDRGSG